MLVNILIKKNKPPAPPSRDTDLYPFPRFQARIYEKKWRMLVNILIKKNKLSTLFPLETLICIHFQGSRPESTKKKRRILVNILIKKKPHAFSPSRDTYLYPFPRFQARIYKKK